MGMLDYLINRTPETRARVRADVIAGRIPRWVANSKRKGYILAVLKSCPDWVCREELKLIQLRVRQRTELEGVEYHTAHIVPLTHPRMCGLTVPWNLEIKTAKINLAESNHVQSDDQMALF